MIAFLIHYLNLHLSLNLTVFSFYSARMLLAAFSALLFVVLLGPPLIRTLEKVKGGSSIRTDGMPMLCQLHQKKKNTPTMGGLLILSAMLFSMLLWMDLSHIFTLILFVTTLVLGLLGARDDYLKWKYKNSNGISAKKKLFCQVTLASLLAVYLLSPSVYESLATSNWFQAPLIKEAANTPTLVSSEGTTAYFQIPLQEYASRFYIPFFKKPVLELQGTFLVIAGLLIVFVIVGSSNAVNLTDGLDGLATGCLILVGSFLALFAFITNHIELSRHLNILYVEGSGEIAIYLSALVGACIGFLWYNGSPAQIFMGDTGSLALGGVIGVCAVLLKREALFALVGGVFVAETLSVILQVASYKLRNKKRIFACAPLHHHFECKGWPETKVVIRFWIVGLLLAIVGLASLKFQ